MATLDIVREERLVRMRSTKLKDRATDDLVQVALLLVVVRTADLKILFALEAVQRLGLDVDRLLPVLASLIVWACRPRCPLFHGKFEN